ncbi:zf-HC2 domain-containing protein [Nonomuraea sp. NPDC049695]|uniref:anti-sigma factor family protein n=1 Tax=Nonomuraea sp. NPDC049695 TaxID=3154734 RepID=UPI0034186DB7
MMTCEEVRLALGAHALGALDPDEALEVDQHLATCEECGAELLDLEGVASFLGKVSERDVELVVSPPRQVLDRLLNDRVKRTRRGRLLLVAAASVVALALGGTVWTAMSNSTQSQGAMAPVSATPASTQPPASVLDATEDSKAKSLSSQAEPSATRKPSMLASKRPSRAPREAVDGPTFKGRNGGYSASVSAWPGDDGGTELGVQVGGVPVGTTCSLLVVAADGRRERTQSWAVSQEAYEENTVFKRVTSLPMDDIARFDVVDQAGKVLVRVPVRK